MILTCLFSILLFASLWPYFIAIGLLKLKYEPNEREPKIIGRPNRRSVHRKNSDIVKCATSIFGAYIIFNAVLYGIPDLRGLIPTDAIIAIVVIILAFVFATLPIVNRYGHAYLGTGQLMVVHAVSAISTFHIFYAVIYDNFLSFQHMGAIALTIFGLMVMFSGYKMEAR
jgi:uncharacterized protein (DUF486 family)